MSIYYVVDNGCVASVTAIGFGSTTRLFFVVVVLWQLAGWPLINWCPDNPLLKRPQKIVNQPKKTSRDVPRSELLEVEARLK